MQDHLAAHISDLEELMNLEILDSGRLQDFLSKIKVKLDQKKRAL